MSAEGWFCNELQTEIWTEKLALTFQAQYGQIFQLFHFLI